mmetsp:Transcript_1835/g.3087  ORF Transcript_1835/g.3087 Transcript_1835/m.3087 type:complete len:926 (+) Transcript_1835:171-2948(+)|eukprot:CAMPEP_0203745530 /NCGR_PEP_ID=MMETSP0098-20131031/1230_1 /ASSEMBLY_ACC=CAM_ASM_000208 /TAXON_ID=96639 /ORGANISM=" , Strain NY0313808BC1" /LENGTH=925 /DNA_ID=CAMNT_0050633329 /DNA_START=91 /DNA_END=2868 /DNA_ORIENTATION=+
MSVGGSALGGGWVPEDGALQSVINLISASLGNAVSNERHKEIQQEVDTLCLKPEFARYLSFVFAEAQNFGGDVNVRYMASLILVKATRVGLKKNIFDVASLDHIKRSALRCMEDQNQLLRKSASNLVSTIITFNNLCNWPDLIVFLERALNQTANESLFSAAFMLLDNLCEENGQQLATDRNGQTLTVFVGFLLSNLSNPLPKYRIKALVCFNHLMGLEMLPTALSAHAEDLLRGLSVLTQDPDSHVKKEVCLGLTFLLSLRSDVVQPHLEAIILFMLECIGHENDLVALEACEFFSELCEDPRVAENALRPHLELLIPKLLKRMEYSEDELLLIMGEDEALDTSVPDRPEDLRPTFHSASTGAGSNEANGDGDDDDEEDQFTGQWTTRKAAALALDEITYALSTSLTLPIILPMLQANLSNKQDWKVREAALLALGALTRGCMDALEEHLPGLVPFLLEQVQDRSSLVRSITLWTLSKYSQWVCDVHGTGKPGDGLVQAYAAALTRATMDRNKKVQHSACSALATFAEYAGEMLDPFIGEIGGVLVNAFSMYQTKSKMQMLDTIGTLFENAPEGAKSIYPQLMPVLWNSYQGLNDIDPLVTSFLDCFGLIAKQVGVAIGNYAKPVYDRCLRLLEGTLTILAANVDMGLGPDECDREPMYTALDTLGGLAVGLKSDFRVLVGDSNFLALFGEILKDSDADTRQCAFGLFGELVSSVPQIIEPIVPLSMEIMAKTIYPVDEDNINVSVNAAWAIGELTIKLRENIRPFADEITNRLVLLLVEENLEHSLKLNAAITLGRIALFCPDVVAEHLHDCAIAWCIIIKMMVQDSADRLDASLEEKENCVYGLYKAIQVKPMGIAGGAFSYFCVMLATALNDEPTNEFFQASHNVMTGLKATFENVGVWQKLYGALPNPVKQELRTKNVLN